MNIFTGRGRRILGATACGLALAGIAAAGPAKAATVSGAVGHSQAAVARTTARSASPVSEASGFTLFFSVAPWHVTWACVPGSYLVPVPQYRYIWAATNNCRSRVVLGGSADDYAVAVRAHSTAHILRAYPEFVIT